MPARETKTLCVTNATGNLPSVRDFISEAIDACGVGKSLKNKVILAVDEAVSNIIEHAYAEAEEGTEEIRICVEGHDDCLKIMISDMGTRFDTGDVAVPDIKKHILEGRKNGLGMFLMRQIMDEVSYTFKSGVENELTMVKYIREQDGEVK